MKTFITLIAIIYPFSVFANTLSSFTFTVPIDEHEVAYHCAKAFDEAIADKKTEEQHESVRCAANITPTVHDDLLARFSIQCKNTCAVIAKSTAGSQATMDAATLMEELKEAMPYAPSDTCQAADSLHDSILEYQTSTAVQESTSTAPSNGGIFCFGCH
jgi:hypothetical protein